MDDCTKYERVRRIDGKCDLVIVSTLPHRRKKSGKCNNMEPDNQQWGAAAINMRRLAPPAYNDGRETPRVVNVSPREVSNGMHRQTSLDASSNAEKGPKGFTHMSMQWGQFLDHDITFTPEGGISLSALLYILGPVPPYGRRT